MNLINENMKVYYDVVASVYSGLRRVESHLIVGGFGTEYRALRYINSHNISEVIYRNYLNSGEEAYIEIEEHSADGTIMNVGRIN